MIDILLYRTRKFWTLVLLWCRLQNPKVDLLFGSAQGSGWQERPSFFAATKMQTRQHMCTARGTPTARRLQHSPLSPGKVFPKIRLTKRSAKRRKNHRAVGVTLRRDPNHSILHNPWIILMYPLYTINQQGSLLLLMIEILHDSVHQNIPKASESLW